MSNILIIPFYPPNKINASAGNKISTYFIDQLSADPEFKVRVLTFKVGDEMVSNIDNAIIDYIDISKRTIERIKRAFFEINWQINPIDRSAGHYYGYRRYILSRKLAVYKLNYQPDIVILEWVESILYIDVIKQAYPKAKIIGFVHDVCFQKVERQVQHTKNRIANYFLNIRHKRLHNFEMESYRKCDKIIVLNSKDRDLLVNEGIAINDITIVTPFFEKMSCSPIFSNNMVFLGDLRRPENYTGCIWFIENVFNKIVEEFSGIKFVIAGKDAPPELQSYNNGNVILTGFVKSVIPVFENAFCFVAPLYLGAGIKIKVLEAMSASLPVLTGDVGIEGINAQNGKEYIHCDTAVQYIDAITKLFKDKLLAKDIGRAGSEFINTEFSIDRALMNYKNLLKAIV